MTAIGTDNGSRSQFYNDYMMLLTFLVDAIQLISELIAANLEYHAHADLLELVAPGLSERWLGRRKPDVTITGSLLAAVLFTFTLPFLMEITMLVIGISSLATIVVRVVKYSPVYRSAKLFREQSLDLLVQQAEAKLSVTK